MMNTCINKIEKIWIDNATFFIEGLAYIQGYNSPDYKTLHKYIRFKNLLNDDVAEFVLGTVPKIEMSNQLYQGESYNYTAAGTATADFHGIDISDFPIGVYEIQISVSKNKEVRNYINLNVSSVELDKHTADNFFEYRIYQKDGSIHLTKKDIFGKNISDDSHVSVVDCWVRDSVFHIEGEFIVPEIPLKNFSAGGLLLNSQTTKWSSAACC